MSITKHDVIAVLNDIGKTLDQDPNIFSDDYFINRIMKDYPSLSELRNGLFRVYSSVKGKSLKNPAQFATATWIHFLKEQKSPHVDNPFMKWINNIDYMNSTMINIYSELESFKNPNKYIVMQVMSAWQSAIIAFAKEASLGTYNYSDLSESRQKQISVLLLKAFDAVFLALHGDYYHIDIIVNNVTNVENANFLIETIQYVLEKISFQMKNKKTFNYKVTKELSFIIKKLATDKRCRNKLFWITRLQSSVLVNLIDKIL